MSVFLEKVTKIVGASNLFTEKADLIASSVRPGAGQFPLPDAIARPVNVSQVVELVQLCKNEKVGLHPRGGGTFPGIPIPAGSWLVLQTTGLDRILSIEPENRLAVVQSGVTLAELDKAISPYGLFFPPESTTCAMRSVGGVIAANSPGENYLEYGPPGNFLIWLEAITGTGEKLRLSAFNDACGKIEASLPLASLYCGSCGCLGFISLLALRLLPAPPTSLSLYSTFRSAVDAAQAAVSLCNFGPARLNLFNETCAGFLGESWPFLALRFSGTREAVAVQIDKAMEILKSKGAREIRRMDEPGKAEIFPAAFALKKQPFILRVSACPPGSLPAFIEALETITRDCGLDCAVCALSGGAKIFIALYGEAEKTRKALKDIFTLELVISKRMDSDELIDKAQWQKLHPVPLAGEIRRIFDPDGIFAINQLPGYAR